jgi:hypothetical protein
MASRSWRGEVKLAPRRAARLIILNQHLHLTEPGTTGSVAEFGIRFARTRRRPISGCHARKPSKLRRPVAPEPLRWIAGIEGRVSKTRPPLLQGGWSSPSAPYPVIPFARGGIACTPLCDVADGIPSASPKFPANSSTPAETSTRHNDRPPAEPTAALAAWPAPAR